MSSTIKVFPGTHPDILHPTGGPVRSRGSMWPNDVFTHRRIADGTVTLVQQGSDVAKGGTPEVGVRSDVGETRRAIIAEKTKPTK